MTTDSVEIRPKAQKNAIVLAVGCGLFTVAGLWMMASGEGVFAGLLAVVFFGGGGIYAIPKLLSRKVSMALTPEHLEMRYPQGNASLPWTDIERVEIVTMFSNRMVGLRLKTYDHYLRGMSPSLAAFMTRNLPYLKWMARATSLLDVPGAVGLWSKFEGRDASEGLKSFGNVGDLAQGLLWCRKQTGCDIVFSWAEIDRSTREFAALLEGYVRRAEQTRAS